MAWKVEKWLAELFPGESNIYVEYHDLPTRELVIVAAAVIDAALAELIAKRLRSIQHETEEFLGVNGDGRAPVASLGARIQLALLIGLITEEDAEILRAVKNLRNTFAHRARASFLSYPAQAQVRVLFERWRKLALRLEGTGTLNINSTALQEIGEHLPKQSEASEGLLLAVFATYQAYFHLLSANVPRINLVQTQGSGSN